MTLFYGVVVRGVVVRGVVVRGVVVRGFVVSCMVLHTVAHCKMFLNATMKPHAATDTTKDPT